ncbi:MAG: diguanylate cyclase [Deinococcales bacterium]
MSDIFDASDNFELEASSMSVEDMISQINKLNEEAYRLRGYDIMRSMKLSRQAYELSTTGDYVYEPYSKGLVESLLNLGYNHLHRHDYHLALADALEAEAYCEEGGHKSDCYNLLGVSYMRLGGYDEALSNLLKALQYVEAESYHGDILGNIGTVYTQLGELDEALKMLKHALELKQSQEQPDRSSLSSTWNNLARVYLELNYDNQALVAAQRALELAKRIGLGKLQSQPLNTCGMTYFKLGDFAESLRHYEASLKISRPENDRLAQLYALRGIGEVHFAQGDYELALAFLEQAIELANFLDSVAEQYLCHQLLANIYEKQGDFPKALSHHRRYHKQKEQVFNVKLGQRVRMVQLMHEAERAQKDAEIYQLKHVELERQFNELKRLHEKVAWISNHDELTGLYSRRYFNEQLEQAFHRKVRYGNALSLIMLDIDNFKSINDLHSHPFGDKVLVSIAEILKQNTRTVDIVARYGGEEFVIILPELDLAHAVMAAERLRKAISQHDWSTLLGNDFQVTISLGVASAEGLSDYDRLIAIADHKLYQAKQQGKNKVCA